MVHGFTWSEDGAFIYTTGTDKKLKCWDMSTGHDSLVMIAPDASIP